MSTFPEESRKQSSAAKLDRLRILVLRVIAFFCLGIAGIAVAAMLVMVVAGMFGLLDYG